MRIFHRSHRPLWLLLPLFFSAPPARPDALPPPKIPDSVGVNIHFTGAPAKDLDGIKDGGFGWIRMDFAWAGIEKTKGVYDFAAYDELVDGLTARKIKPLFILDYGNDLYQKGSPRTPEARAAFAKFAGEAAKHFAGKPILWEIWNEPNIGFWQPRPNADEYARLALETAQAVKKADPKATVLAAGTSGFPLPFLETAFKMGLLRFIDAVSVHPYRGSAPETVASDFRALRLLTAKYAPKGRDIPLVSSEWGYSTVGVSEKTQAQYFARQQLVNLSEGVRLSIWYDWKEDGADPKENEHHFGTVRPDLTPKPAYLAAQTLTRVLGGYRFVKRIPLASEDDWLLLFARGPGDVKLAAWTVGAEHAISLPLAGTPAVRAMGGEVQGMNSAATSGRLKLTLAGSPQYVAPAAQGNESLALAAAWTATAPSPFYAAGQPIKLILTLANADAGKSHRVKFLVALSAPNQPQPTSIVEGEDVIGPGTTLRQGASSTAFSRVPVRARVALVLDGVRQPYPQDVLLTPTDPLSLSVAPAGAGGYRAQIGNPAGTAFEGVLERSAPGQKATRARVRLTAGQKSADAVVLGDPQRAAVFTLRDSGGATAAALPARRFVPYPLIPAQLQTRLDGDLKVASTVRADAPPNGAVLKVTYDFAPGWTFWHTGEANPMPLPGKPEAFGLWVYGDGSGQSVRMRFRDATGQTFQPDGGLLDWTGWRFVTFALTLANRSNAGHWGGANDGVIHYPIHIENLFLLDSAGGAKKTRGSLSLGRPSVIYAARP